MYRDLSIVQPDQLKIYKDLKFSITVPKEQGNQTLVIEHPLLETATVHLEASSPQCVVKRNERDRVVEVSGACLKLVPKDTRPAAHLATLVEMR